MLMTPDGADYQRPSAIVGGSTAGVLAQRIVSDSSEKSSSSS